MSFRQKFKVKLFCNFYLDGHDKHEFNIQHEYMLIGFC